MERSRLFIFTLLALTFYVLIGSQRVQAQDAPTTAAPTTEPTDAPTTAAPTTEPTDAPTTAAPTTEPTDAPTTEPTDAPTTAAPTTEPTDAPTTAAPTTEPTDAPTTAAATTTEPTDAPSTSEPTDAPTTPLDGLTVECTKDKMIVTLEYAPIVKIDLDKVTLKDDDCQLSEYGSLNDTHLMMKTPLDSCKTNYTAGGDTITYQNSLIVKSSDEGGEDSEGISREFTTEFIFTCSYPSSALVSVVNFSPSEKVIYTKTVEYGNFTYMMDMYETDQYETPYDSYPVNLDLNDPMYLQVKVVSNDSQLVIIPIKCWATPEPEPEASDSYTFIKDGCNSDDTLVFDYDQNAVQRFTLDAFYFPAYTSPDDVVYLHCNVQSCRKNDSDSRCAEGCVNNEIMKRKRRDLLRNSLQQTISVGPVIKKDQSDKLQSHNAAESESLPVFAIVAGVLALAVVVLAVALVMLYKRYTNTHNVAESV
ncbi:unnamed protein product [Porites lobata]|uniref:ZP domain-containing protein n=1 Tax=Porites lobata TaxID=104759 RepID=A0ABN8PSH2_9CNID|nr:unnamed protein product [Porites lobata]